MTTLLLSLLTTTDLESDFHIPLIVSLFGLTVSLAAATLLKLDVVAVLALAG